MKILDTLKKKMGKAITKEILTKTKKQATSKIKTVLQNLEQVRWDLLISITTILSLFLAFIVHLSNGSKEIARSNQTVAHIDSVSIYTF